MGIPGRQLRTYVVEDSTVLLKRLADLLDEVGIDVVGHADNAVTAIREIATMAPDVIIVDIALRNGNGFDVLRAFAPKNGVRRPTPIVLSNYTAKPYRTAAQRLGVEYYFDKSSEIFTMLQILQSMARGIGLRNGSER